MQSKSNHCYLIFKRFVDIVVSLCALIFVAPITLIVWIIDQFGSNKGPVFYRQRRIGKNHKPFYIYKYRSMVVDAEERLRKNKELHSLYVKNSYKLPPDKDPRITKFGRFIRKSSLDEIPQFLNILKGDMTLIGPRPVVEEELKEYGDRVDEFLSVTPGAMGYWQASGRSEIAYPKRCEVELYYVRNASFWFDIKILTKNIISIFKTNGAY
ncbi:sugar transferase [Ligilactobacillus equi]|uniref:Undecaprenyl-phosphate galactose phosphotransferase n=1 Tax=Ligilactobacillus equi DSM 15833 = JCM 10991 TaxID=1423740 RepID=A0A0R1T8T9_9LACO|nr:sugar transferase [Ligilactobacillus equi]KRL76580.1 undecaprenyl-phosphate galactose phosphotransferase [Ligilactobacillus equi DSM 15833 = JCM 10991]